MTVSKHVINQRSLKHVTLLLAFQNEMKELKQNNVEDTNVLKYKKMRKRLGEGTHVSRPSNEADQETAKVMTISPRSRTL